MGTNSGWIKIHRQIQEWELWEEEPFTKAQAWVDLLLLANHKAKSIFVRGVEVKIERGVVGWSEDSLAKKWKWSRKKVRNFKNFLKKEHQIEITGSKVISLIFILNYEKYQSEDTTEDTTEGQQKIQQKNTNKNVKNVKNDKNNTNVSKDTLCVAHENTKTLKTFSDGKPDPRNAEIQNLLIALKNKIGISEFADCRKWERIYARNLLLLLKNLGKDEFVRRLDLILSDPFKHKNCNKIRFVYEQIKGFIEPKATFLNIQT